MPKTIFSPSLYLTGDGILIGFFHCLLAYIDATGQIINQFDFIAVERGAWRNLCDESIDNDERWWCCDIASERYHLTLTAADVASPSLSSSLSVLVIIDDVSDNMPQFDRPVYNVTLAVTAPVSSFVVRVSARDVDSGLNAQVRYRFAARTQVRKLTQIQPFESLVASEQRFTS